MKPVRNISLIPASAIIVFSFMVAHFSFAQDDTDIVIGKITRLQSKVLNEERPISIYTPRGYERSQDKYPVLYVLDGEGNFFFASAVVNFLARTGRIPQMLVVAIPNTDRTRDFTPTRVQEQPNSGGADSFLKFMESELVPFIEKNYRTQPFRILMGHSLCGMFSVYTLFTRPELFNAHVAVSPYLMFDNEIVLKRIEPALGQRVFSDKFLYVTIGNEPDYTNSLNRLTELLKTSTNSPKWQFLKMEQEDHGSVPLKSLYDGLEFIYDGWNLPPEVATGNITAIEAHFAGLSQKYGYTIQVPEFVINRLGYQFMGQSKVAEAIELFKYNVKVYPNSANVYDSLGEGYETNNQFELAKKNYEIAIEKGLKNSDPNMQIYKNHLDGIMKKLGGSN